jgi:hypothetical protein
MRAFFFFGLMTTIYLDESGDLGWKFDADFKRGGSSRYLTIAAAVIKQPKDESKLERVIRGFYKSRKRAVKNELKSTDLSSKERSLFAAKLVDIKTSNDEIKFFSMTVRKEMVNDSFRAHPNGLYNYMVKLLLLNEMSNHDEVNFIPDARTVSVELKNSLNDYLRTELAGLGASTKLNTTPWESKNSLSLQFVDTLANIIWSRHEYDQSKHYSLISSFVQSHHLYFHD